MPSPPTVALPKSSRPIPSRTILPSPATEIIEATTAMDSDRRTVWFSPARMVGRASGSWVPKRTRASLAPNARAASTRSLRTSRIPRLVKRISGVMAKMQVTITPGVSPMPKSMTTGTRYTKLGIVCSRSRIGRRTRKNPSKRAARMPVGIPMTMQIVTAEITIDSVVIAACHAPRRPISVRQTNPVSARRRPERR